MEFNKIIAVTGKPGLFEVVSQTKTGIIVESLMDKKRIPILSTHNVSLLENIAIFTYEEEVPLLTVFKSISEKAEGKETISHKESGKNYLLSSLKSYQNTIKKECTLLTLKKLYNGTML